MIDAGMHVVLIKVAGIGLTTKHLGKSLEEMRPTFFKLASIPPRTGSKTDLHRMSFTAPTYVGRVENMRASPLTAHSSRAEYNCEILRLS